MMKKSHSSPAATVVAVEDKHREVLFPRLTAEERRARAQPSERARLQGAALVPSTVQVQEDLQAVRRRPLDAPMAALDPPATAISTGRLVLTLLLIAAGFIGGVVVGRLA